MSEKESATSVWREEIDESRLVELNQNYLWRTIYPKTNTGKPVYNVQGGGKHAVKLYAGGHWRKIYVDDSLPVRNNGKIAVAHSIESLELWPILLAKGIYTIYTTLGYHFLEDTSLSQSMKESSFLAFAIHSLTGWNPHQIANASNLFTMEPSKTMALLKNMISVGVPLIAHEDVVHEENCFLFLDPENPDILPASLLTQKKIELENEAFNDGNANSEDLLKTKHRFKAEYDARKQKRDHIVSAILERERRIQQVHTSVTTSCSEELFSLICWETDQSSQAQVFPILAIVFPNSEVESNETAGMKKTSTITTTAATLQFEFTRLGEVQFLVKWQKETILPVIANDTDDILLGRGKYPVKEFMEPLPMATPASYRWMTLSQLQSMVEVHLVAWFTGLRTPQEAHWTWRWQPLIPIDPVPTGGKDAKGGNKAVKGKEKSGKDESIVSEVIIYSESQSAPPPTFLSLDVKHLLETAEAISAQKLAFQNLQDGSSLLEDTQVLEVRLTINVEADMIELSSSEVPTAAVALGGSHSTDDLSASGIHSHPTLPSDTVIVLQEVGLPAHDSHEEHDTTQLPRVFILKLPQQSALPNIAKTFTFQLSLTEIQSKYLSHSQMFFWLRVYSKNSLAVTVRSNAIPMIDLAEQLWTKALFPEKSILKSDTTNNTVATTTTTTTTTTQQFVSAEVFVAEGDIPITIETTEQLVFRLPLITAHGLSGTTSEPPTWTTTGAASLEPTSEVMRGSDEHKDGSQGIVGVIPAISTSIAVGEEATKEERSHSWQRSALKPTSAKTARRARRSAC
jgi:hypothetical protein